MGVGAAGSVSVCMATFNGEKFVRAQIESILLQLCPDDELIIVDDCSTDGTYAIISAVSSNCVRVFQNSKNCGHVRTFARAIELSSKELIFLADQDDIWAPGRRSIMAAYLTESSSDLVTGDFICIDSSGEVINAHRRSMSGNKPEPGRYFLNIIEIIRGTSGYYGSAMGLNRRIFKTALPIPRYVEAHDIWFAIAANLTKSSLHVDRVVLHRRLHGGNLTTSGRPLWKKAYSRFILFRSIVDIFIRIFLQKLKF